MNISNEEKRDDDQVLNSVGSSVQESMADVQTDSGELASVDAKSSVRLRIEETCPEEPITVDQMFKASVEKYGNMYALASKKCNKWEKITFLEYYHFCRRAARSFIKLGLERFHGVAILGFNSAEWFFSAVGAIMAGGIMTGIYATNTPEACKYVASDSKANIIVVENQKQLDKILQWEEFMELGLDVSEKELDDISNSQKANQCCVLIYTSGTTGKPKGVMLSHDNITWTANHASRAGDMQPADTKQESLVSYLPLSHIAAQIYDLWTGIHWGVLVYFAQPDALKGSLITTLREVCPTSHMGVPRVWEKMMEKIKQAISECGYVKKKLVNWAMSVSLETNQKYTQMDDEKPLIFSLANSLVLQRLRAGLGLSCCQKFFSGAAPIGSETVQFFLGLNIRLYEAYGMSESTGPHFISGPKAYKLLSCGKVVPGCRYKMTDVDSEGTGEICFWGRNIFMGFLNMEEKTREALDEDGWLHSGDLGKIDEEGFLYITGRVKVDNHSRGENVPPVPIEDAVKKELPFVSNAMLIGDKRKFLSMLLTLKSSSDTETMEPTEELSLEAVEYCRQLGSQATMVSDIIEGKDKDVYRAIQEGIDRVNSAATSNAQRIQKWTILRKDFSVSGGELGKFITIVISILLSQMGSHNEALPPCCLGDVP
ncbi:hypothetical protein PAMA_019424 [Pampus argenteus]